MRVDALARQVTIFINSTDQHHGKPLYTAIIELAQRMNIGGATVLRAVEGYGTSHHLHTTRLLGLSENLPIQIEMVDVPERMAPFLDALDGLIVEGYVTIADVQTRHYLKG